MAAKDNDSGDTIDLTTYDWVGKGIISPTLLNKDATDNEKIKVPACGWCHPGGGPAEFARDAAGEASATRYDALDEASQADYDGDFWTMAGAGVDKNDGARSHWAESGVVEADCLMCHLSGYSFGKRAYELTHRNYKWAATAGAKFGSIGGTDVYDFTETTASSHMNGTWTGATPTVAYDITQFTAAGELDAERMVSVPGRAQCTLCHFSPEVKKRGRDPKAHPETDVHINGIDDDGDGDVENLECLDCHGMISDTSGHNIGKGYARLGSVANTLDGTMRAGCADCHGGAVSTRSDGTALTPPDPVSGHAALQGLDFHFDRISCETCHIPSKDLAAGALIDMSAGKQVWYLTSDDTITWAGDFTNNAKPWTPLNKFYDPEGDGGAKLYPFAPKSTVWFGRMSAGGEVEPIILRQVWSAYQGLTAPPTVSVDYVKDGSTLMKPSVSAEADVVAMLAALDDPAKGRPVLVQDEQVQGLDAAGTGLEILAGVHGETDHNFSVNHDVRDAAEALGAGGCGDCHDPAAPLFEATQVADVTGYLAESYKTRAAAYVVPMWEKQGYTEEAAARLAAAVDPADLHATVVSYTSGGANTCAACHPDQVAAFKDTVHYASRSVVENENFFFPGGGKHGMLDRACALVGSNMLLNMITTGYTELASIGADSGTLAQQCGSCHTNYYNTLMEPMLAQQMGAGAAEQVMLSGVDCLICHAETYDMRLRKTLEVDPYGLNAGFGTVNGEARRVSQDRSATALDSITGSPSDEMCLRCHEHGRTDYKRGELPEPDHDIHYELGVSADNPCTFCHEVTDHKFNRGAMVNGDIFASDHPVNGDDNDAACVNCHTDWPHRSDRLNDHVAKLACETCHITYTAGAATTVWADGGFLGLAKGTDNRPVKLYSKKEDANTMTPEQLWEAYRQRPIYMPFSGLTSFLAQSVPITNQAPLLSGKDPIEPKIYPFKTIINPLPFDGRFFGVGVDDTDRNGDGVNDYSMFAAMEMFAGPYKALGFMDADFDFTEFAVDPGTGMVATTMAPTDPAYPSYAAMAQMAAFPNMLFFDKYTFGYNWYQNLQPLAEAGEIVQWDDRPLAAKDMRKAVEVGMGRLLDMMVQVGFDPSVYGMTAGQMKAMYAKYDATGNPMGMSPDQLVVMAAPPGSEMQLMLRQMKAAGLAEVSDTVIDNYPAWSNGVTLGGHGVRRDQALFCADCHSTAAGANVFDQPVEVPAYGDHGLPLMQWTFYSAELLDEAEAGRVVADVEQAGYVEKGTPFEMGRGFRAAGQDADALGITYGLDGGYLAVLTPVTRLVSNWKVLGYSDQRVAELTNRTAVGGVSTGGDAGDDVGTDVTGSSECFVQTLGGGIPVGAGWAAALGVVAAALGVSRRRR